MNMPKYLAKFAKPNHIPHFMKKALSVLNRILAASAGTLIFLTTISVASCSGNNDEEEIENNACRFAEYYFNCLYKDAMEMCTPESAKWLSYAASNISQEDIDILNSQKDDATCESTDLTMENDSTAEVTIKVKNFLMMDSIGVPSKMRDSALYSIVMRKRDGQWKAHLCCMPQEVKKKN